jgi:Ras-related protein Rab-21
MLRYVEDKFNEKHLSTIQAAFLKKKIKIGNNQAELSIWVSKIKIYLYF